MSIVESTPPETGQGGGAQPQRRGLLMRPGLIRGAWCFAVFFLVGLYLVAGVRWLAGWDPVYDWSIIVLVGALILGPVGFLLGIGAFDYWLYWISGRPTLAEDHSSHGAHSWKDYFRVNTDHKVIGVQYLATTFVFFVIGGFMAMLFRAELAQPGMQFVDTQTFNGLVSVHAALMIFVFIIPAFAGLANYVVPLMLGAPDMAFPRLERLVVLAAADRRDDVRLQLPRSGRCVRDRLDELCTARLGAADRPGVLQHGRPVGRGLVDHHGAQLPGHDHHDARAGNDVLADAAARLGQLRDVVVGGDRDAVHRRLAVLRHVRPGHAHELLRSRKTAGYVLGYQHIFWFYSHPAVYIMILPGFGIISEVISVMSRKPIFGYRLMAMSLLGIIVLSFSVWAHHMFVAGMADWLRIPMMITSLLIAVPTGIKIFSWLATLWGGRIQINTPMLFALGFISTFVIGGLSGIYLASVPIDIHASDTYFIVAHIHYVLFGGSVFTIFAGIYYWFPKMTGRMYNERLGKLHFWLMYVSFNATFFPMHWVGLQGMPRRVADYSDRFADVNLVVSIASFVLGASMVIFFYNVIVSWARGPIAESNPWRAMTLEWQVTSPPPVFNFDEIPQVVGGPYEYGVPGAQHAILSGSPVADRTTA